MRRFEMISVEGLNKIFSDCLFMEEELKNDPNYEEKMTPVEGITSNFGFHKERLLSHKEEVKKMLMQLPKTFRRSEGGGWSFLNACDDKDGNQWTGLHSNMEQLFVLGMGLGLCEYCAPKEMWAILPGGMPFIVINEE